MTTDVLINVMNALAIALGFAASASRSVGVLCDGAVNLLMDVLAGGLTIVVIGCPPGMSFDDLANVVVGVKTERNFVTPAPLEGFSC